MPMIFDFPPFAAWQKPWASNLLSILHKQRQDSALLFPV